MTARLLVLLLLAPLAACDTLIPTDAPWDSAPASEPWHEMLDAINAKRAAGATCGDERYPAAGPLAWNSRLEQAALDHTMDMVRHEHFAHVGTDGSRPGERAKRAGYRWRVVGENIARYQNGLDEVVEDWMESDGHCRQIMDPAFVEMGAVERDRYWTQVFGLPR